jgi:Rod binding domain-containing protein
MINPVGGQNKIPQNAAGDPAAGAPPKLVKAAHEFEAILLESWLEKMNKSFVGETASLDPAHDTVSSLGSQAIAQALAARGGIGIANMILRQLGNGKKPQPAEPVGENTGQIQPNKDIKVDSGIGR